MDRYDAVPSPPGGDVAAAVLLSSSGEPGHFVTRVWDAKASRLLATLNSVGPVSFWPGFSSTPVRNVTPAGQLAIAFRTVYGASASSAAPHTLTHEEKTYEVRPTALEWMGETAVLLTSADDTAGCHACSGALGIHYLTPKGAGLAVKGSWPFLLVGGSNGYAPGVETIRRDLGRNPFLTTRSGFSGQGQICASLSLTELAPTRPIPRGSVFLHYGNEGAVSDGEAATSWTGRIVQPVPDRAFDVVYTGSERFTEHYQLRGEVYRPEGASRFEDFCG